MNNFDYIMHNDNICVLIEQRESNSTIAGIQLSFTADSYFAYEIDVPNNHISVCKEEVSEKSIIHRLRNWRRNHEDIFGFLDSEMQLIHPFK